MFLAFVDGGLKHLALGRKPEPIINELGVTRHEFILEVGGAAIKRQTFDATMRNDEDRAAWRFIHAARFHADKAIFDKI